MSIHTPKKPRRINTVSVTLTLILAVGGYFGWFYLPHWFAVWRLTGAMMSIGRSAYREFDNEKLMEKLLVEGRRNGLQVSRDNFAMEREAYTEDELINATDLWRRVARQRGKRITISFATTINAKWPLIDKVTPLYFENVREVDLSTDSW